MTNEKPFTAGRLKNFLPQWKKLTSDVFILDMIQGARIPLLGHEKQAKGRTKNQVQGNLYEEMDKEISKLLEMDVIKKSLHEVGEVISPVFMVPKPDGSYRMILNLKEFNENVEYQHFKMENLHSATKMIREGCYMASVDLRHAYYSVPLAEDHQKFLKFVWRNQLYQYTCFPNGLSSCPRYFTKLMKPVYAHLRKQGFLSASFIDDCYLQGATIEECYQNIDNTVTLFESLGFVVHSKKSVLEPTRKLTYLGFCLDSEKMYVTLPDERVKKLRTSCLGLLKKKRFTVRELAQVIGQMVAAFPAVQWGPLYYRQLEKDKSEALKCNEGNFEALITLSDAGREELEWWIENITTAFVSLKKNEPSVEIKTDASTTGGWGATCDSTSQTGGRWSKNEKLAHINVLELLAIEFALKSFQEKVKNKHVKILTDNVCAVAYVRNMGGSHSQECNEVAKRIWQWCKLNDVWITIAHIPGKLNVQADTLSRKFHDNTEWQLNPNIFQKVVQKFGMPDIDLFASRLNHQLKPFVSWKPDPEAYAVDAFTMSWNTWFTYAFPPFSLIHQVLGKLEREQAECIMIIPDWPTAVWYPQFLRLLIHQPLKLPRGKTTLQLTHKRTPHPLHQKLHLLAVRLSGKQLKHKEFMAGLVKLCVPLGEGQRKDSTQLTLNVGNFSVLRGRKIPFLHL